MAASIDEFLKQIRQDFARSGGLARAKKLSAARRSEIAKKAAKASWKKRKGKTRAA
jgi:hypothetical protein